MFKKLDRVILSVSDLEESVSFYQNVMGFDVTFKSSEVCTINFGDTELVLQPMTEELADPRPIKHGSALNFKTDDLAAACDALKKQGAPMLVAPKQGHFGMYAQFVDPDGRIISISERKKSGG